jgi:phospholipid/cholesterol/gamma-HCH transport system substrate-binding protein
MRDRSLEFKVGALILVSVAVLAGFVLVLGNFSMSSGYTVYVDYNFSGNIQVGAPVKVSGIKVGTVEEVEFLGGALDAKTGRRPQVRVHLWVEDRVRDAIHEDAEFFVNTAGVLGERYLEIVPGSVDRPPLEPGAVVVGVDPPRTDLVVARLYETLDSLSTLLREDRDLIRDLLVNSAGTVKQLNVLLSNNQESIGKLIVATEGMATQATGLMKDFRKGIGDPAVIGRTVRDADRLLVSANQAIETITPKAEVLLDDAARVTGIVTEDRVERTLKVADNAVALTGKAGHLVENVNGMVINMRAGKGTAGALLVREELYADIREMIVDLKRNPWKVLWKE